MFHRWLRHQQPTWLVAMFFLIGVALEIQSAYQKNLMKNQTTSRGQFRQAEGEVPLQEISKRTP